MPAKYRVHQKEMPFGKSVISLKCTFLAFELDLFGLALFHFGFPPLKASLSGEFDSFVFFLLSENLSILITGKAQHSMGSVSFHWLDLGNISCCVRVLQRFFIKLP